MSTALLFVGLAALAGFLIEFVTTGRLWKGFTVAVGTAIICGFLFVSALVFQLRPLAHFSHYLPYIAVAAICILVISFMNVFLQEEGGFTIVVAGTVCIFALLGGCMSDFAMNPQDISLFNGALDLVCDQEDYRRLSHYASIDFSHGQESHDVDPNQLLEVTPAMAEAKVKQVLEGVSGGQMVVAGSQFKTVQGHPWAIVSLLPVNYYAYQNMGGMVPGFYRVDALNKDADPEFVSAPIRYVPGLSGTGDLFNSGLSQFDLGRHVALNITLPQQLLGLDISTLEVDESWKPYYSVTLANYDLGTTGYKVSGLALIDADSGQHTTYPISSSRDEAGHLTYDVSQVPEWVNDIFSAGIVREYVNWWGNYSNYEVCSPQRNSGRYEVETIEDVFTEGVRQYQVTMSTLVGDTAMSHLVYVNPRTGLMTGYQVDGARPTLQFITTSAIEKIKDVRGTQVLNVEELEIQQMLDREVIYGVLTNAETKNFAGVLLVQVDRSNDSNFYIIAENIGDAYAQLRRQIAQGGTGETDISQQTQTQQLRGTIERVGSFNVAGETRLSFVMVVTQPAEMAGRTIHFVADLNEFTSLLRDGESAIVTYHHVDYDMVNEVVGVETDYLQDLESWENRFR